MTGPNPKLRPKPWIDAITPYTPGSSRGPRGEALTKLSSNENPLGTSEKAAEALANAKGRLSRYPDGASETLRAAIGERYGLDPARIVCGTGSDEILHLAAGAYAGVGDEILYSRFGFSVYPAAAQRVGATPVEAPDTDYATDIDALIAAITPNTRVLFLANPNNPTGTFCAAADVARLHDATPPDCLLVVDQAYAEYLEPGEGDGALELAHAADNILITRTFSKIYGLAAERIGWAYGPPPVIEALNRIRGPFNVTTGGQEAAIAALGDREFIEKSRLHNTMWRAWLAERIGKLGNAGLRAIPSKANFLLVLFEGPLSAEAAYEGLVERGYITRWLPGQELPHGLRISIGTEQEVRGLAEALEELVSAAL
ncbi:pyridoxal phosphate-dependent aminotransferase [Parasphingopyxis marina]|uniref:Histidinol-phosphate aminotransferase n=1 Tax=Parasphingopyxis marina TaxID=2761622 RepID=A0A842HWD1_9SPHN|nr:histidinol-phosphate transaminase [Parasphingopyxis marina]MBC2776250.1 histidinol-phosphate transaminase [Parasphingopyxis marina]